MYVLWFLGVLSGPVGSIFGISSGAATLQLLKLPPMLADAAIGILLYRAGASWFGRKAGLLAHYLAMAFDGPVAGVVGLSFQDRNSVLARLDHLLCRSGACIAVGDPKPDEAGFVGGYQAGAGARPTRGAGRIA